MQSVSTLALLAKELSRGYVIQEAEETHCQSNGGTHNMEPLYGFFMRT